MQKRVVTISSAAEAVRQLKAVRKRTREINQPIEIRFRGWPRIDVNVKGRRYKSTLPTPLMKALIEYQNAVNRVHAVAVYGASSKALTLVDRQGAELVFKIQEGSTDSSADLSAWMTTLAQGLADKLSSRELIFVVLSIALMASGYFGFSNYLDHKADEIKEQNRHDLEIELIRSNSEARAASEEFAKAALNLVRQVPDARSVKIGKQTFSRSDIEVLNERVRGISVPRPVEGNFRIRAMKQFDDRWSLELLPDGSEEVIKTDLFRAERAAAGIGELSSAFAEEVPVFLQLILRERDGVPVSARIVGVEGEDYLLADQALAAADE